MYFLIYIGIKILLMIRKENLDNSLLYKTKKYPVTVLSHNPCLFSNIMVVARGEGSDCPCGTLEITLTFGGIACRDALFLFF